MDGELGLDFWDYANAKLKRAEADKERTHLDIVLLSTVTHILNPDLVRQMGEEAEGEENLGPPIVGLVEKIAPL